MNVGLAIQVAIERGREHQRLAIGDRKLHVRFMTQWGGTPDRRLGVTTVGYDSPGLLIRAAYVSRTPAELAAQGTNCERRGRLPRNVSDERVENIRPHDFKMAQHYDTGKAVLASSTGDESKAVWLPHSQIEIERHAQYTKGINKNGLQVSLQLITVTVPEWLAKEKGLI